MIVAGGHFGNQWLGDSFRLSSLREVAIVLLKGAIAPESFLRKLPLTASVSSSAQSWQMQMYLSANSSRKGHSNHEFVQLTETGLCLLHPMTTSSWPKQEGSQSAVADRIEQPCRILVCGSPFSQATIQMTWAEDRALLGSNPSAVPGAKIGDWGDCLSPHSFLSPRLAPKR